MSRLAGADELLVRQQVERLEMFTGIETANRYQVMDPQGNILFHAEEESGGVGGFLTRNLLKAMRPFTISLTPPEEAPALTLKSPFRFFFHEVEILDAHGRTLGSVRREFSVFSRRYSVTFECPAPSPLETVAPVDSAEPAVPAPSNGATTAPTEPIGIGRSASAVAGSRTTRRAYSEKIATVSARSQSLSKGGAAESIDR